MVTWEQLKFKVRQWVRLEIDNDEFYSWLANAKFEREVDKTIADLFLAERNGQTS